MMTYTTISGDMWDTIAFKTLGNELLLNKIIEANPEHIDVFIFNAGVTIKIPEVKEATPAGLPKWKMRG